MQTEVLYPMSHNNELALEDGQPLLVDEGRWRSLLLAFNQLFIIFLDINKVTARHFPQTTEGFAHFGEGARNFLLKYINMLLEDGRYTISVDLYSESEKGVQP